MRRLAVSSARSPTVTVVRRVADRQNAPRREVTPALPSASDYCRRARRIRANLAASPRRMHLQLGRLSATGSSPDSPNGTAAERFRDVVERELTDTPGRVLRYSQRLALLDQAERLGVLRFDANLTIASVQHHLGVATAAAPPGRRLPLPLLTFLAVQTLIVFALYLLIHR